MTTAAAMILAGLSVPAQAATGHPSKTHTKAADRTAKAGKTHSAQDALTQASIKAQDTGQPVVVDDYTTDDSTTTAQPDGSFTLDQTAEPTRAWQDATNTWADLDETLQANSDGTYSTKVTSALVTLSGGGSGPLANLTNAGQNLVIYWPSSLPPLPSPTVSGPTATYAGVLPDVDLVVTADVSGSISEVLVVKTAAAAANPSLKSLTFPTVTTGGTTVTATSDGGLSVATGDDADPVYVTDPPIMWDSTPPPSSSSSSTSHAAHGQRAADDPPGGSASDPAAAGNEVSSPDGPGVAAQVAPIGVAAGTSSPASPSSLRAHHLASLAGDPTASAQNGSITLTPDSTMLSSSSTTFPVYIDPTFKATSNRPGIGKGDNAGGKRSWAVRKSNGSYTIGFKNHLIHPDTPKVGLVEVGDCDWPGCNWVERGYVKLRLDWLLHSAGVHLQDASLKFNQAWGPKFPNDNNASNPCSTNSNFSLYYAGTTLPAKDPGWQSSPSGYIATANGLDCPGWSFGFSLLKSGWLSTFLKNNPKAKTFAFMLKADDEGNNLSWRKILPRKVTLSVNFDLPPDIHRANTYPSRGCVTDKTKAPTIGRDDVTLSVVPTTKAKQQKSSRPRLNVHFHLKTDNTDVWSPTVQVASDTLAVASPIKTDSFLAWHTDGLSHLFQWWTDVDDGWLHDTDSKAPGSPARPCYFWWDPGTPMAPAVQPPAAIDTNPDNAVGVFGGPNMVFKIAPCAPQLTDPKASCNLPAGKSPTAGYVYQVNDGPPSQPIPAGMGGPVSVQIPPNHVGVNVLSVYALSKGGNAGQYARNRDTGAPAVYFTVRAADTRRRDGDIDGDGNPDLLLNQLAGNSGLWLARADDNGQLAAPVNIGANGTGIHGDGTGTSADWNGAQVLHGTFGDGTMQDIVAYYPNGYNGDTDQAGLAMLLPTPGSGGMLPRPNPATQPFFRFQLLDPNFSNGIPTQLVAAGYAYKSKTQGAPDLIGIVGDQTKAELVAFSTYGPFGAYRNARFIARPAGGHDQSPEGDSWTHYTLATAQPGDDPTKTVLFALNTTSHKLWESTASGTSVIGAPGTWTQINGWSADPTAALTGADVTASGTVEVWASSPDHTNATPYRLNGTTLTPGTASTLTAPTHLWAMRDGDGSTAAADANTSGSPAALSGGAGWTGDDDDPLVLDGSSGYATLPQQIGSAQQAFTISLSFRADPNTNGILLSTSDGTPGDSTAPAKSEPLMYIGTDGRLYAQAWTGGTKTPMISPTQVDDGQWHTAALTVDAANHDQILYLDSNTPQHFGWWAPVQDAGSHLYAGAGLGTQDMWTSWPRLYNGTYNAPFSLYFSGQIADIAYYPTTLGPSQLPAKVQPNSMVGSIVSALAASPTSLCVNDYQSPGGNGDHVVNWGCNDGAQQTWSLNPNGTITRAGGGPSDPSNNKCLDIAVPDRTKPTIAPSGTKVQIWDCTGAPNQQWLIMSNGALYNQASDRCLDVPGSSTTRGTWIDVATCNGAGANQTWYSPAFPPPSPTQNAPAIGAHGGRAG
jgi:hypothetical protein